MDQDQDPTATPRRRASAMALLAAGSLGAVVLGIGGTALAQDATSDPSVVQEDTTEDATDGTAEDATTDVPEDECDEPADATAGTTADEAAPSDAA